MWGQEQFQAGARPLAQRFNGVDAKGQHRCGVIWYCRWWSSAYSATLYVDATWWRTARWVYGDSRYFLAILRDATYREGRTARKMVTDVGLPQSHGRIGDLYPGRV